MVEVDVSIDIERGADDVFAYLADMANNTNWQQGMVSCRWTSEPPVRVGSTYDQAARFLRRDIVTSFEVTEYETGRRIRIESTRSTMPLDITRTVEPLGDASCRVRALVKGEPQGWQAWFSPLMARMVSRSANGDYARLKDLLEGRVR